MNLFWKYLRSKRKTIFMGMVFLFIYMVSFWLYQLPMAAVVYPVAICVVLGSVFLLYDFGKEREKYNTLEHLTGLTVEMIEQLPKQDTLPEDGYARLVCELRSRFLESHKKYQADYQDMREYYTVWAHQIKTPISAMQLMMQNEDSDLTRKLRGELFRIRQYVDMVLAYIRMDADVVDFVFRKFAVDDMLRPSVRKLAPEFIGRKLSLQYEPVQVEVITDEKWFAFVVEQILSNALKYTRQGTIRIYKMGEQKICISDTGIGIAKEDLPRIFEKGYTGYNGRTDKNASGLGLYLCRRICNKLGITLTIDSALDIGTTVILELPKDREQRE